jgi:acetyl esterase/lipase
MLKYSHTRLTHLLLVAAIFGASIILNGCDRHTDSMAQKGSIASVKRAEPQMQAVLDKLASLRPKPLETLSPEEARHQPTIADAVKALMQERRMSTDPEPVGKIEDRNIAGAAGEIPARIYWPAGAGPFPVILYIHGGGWVIATIDTYDASARALTNAASTVVVSIEYRKGPEQKFPSAHDDAFAAYQWVLANAKSINGDSARIAVVGESAGGNLATNVSIMARDRKVQLPVYQVLIYPVANNSLNSPSMIENAHARPLNRAMLAWFLAHYLNDQSESGDPRIALVNASLSGLPPTMVITAEIDPLRSEGEMLANRLRTAGVAAEYRSYEGMTHEFFGTGAVVDKAKQAVAQVASGLKKAFAIGAGSAGR